MSEVDKTETIGCIGNLNIITPEAIAAEELFQDRIIWLDEEIKEDQIGIVKQILTWNKLDLDKDEKELIPIRIMIFSPGGSLYVNNAIVDAIEMSRTPVYGYNIGQAHSAGCFIFLSCHKRFAFKNSSFLLHKGSASIAGAAEDISAWKKEYDGLVEGLIGQVYRSSNLERKVIEKKMEGEWYFTAKEARNMGMVDKIVHKIEAIWE